MTAPTAAQRRAADPRRSLWVSANAGTGKTRVLTDRVLRLLLDGAHPECILCLTFTKAAAAEMIVRVEERLARWAAMPDAALAAELTNLVGEPPESRRRDRARQLLATVLELPRGLQIMTIHGLCGALLRRFPIEAGVAPHFETIDDRTAAELMGEAREAVLQRARDTGSPLGVAVAQLVVTLAEQSLAGAVAEMLAQRVPLVAVADGDVEVLIGRVRGVLDVEAAATPASVESAFCAAGTVDTRGLVAACEALGSDNAKARIIAAWVAASEIDRRRLLGEYRQVFLTTEGEPRKQLVTKKLAATSPAGADALLVEQARCLRLEDRLRAVVLATRTEALLRAGFAAIEEYELRKRQRAALDFDDLIERARLLLAGGADWVMFKLDERIEHLLVDEAQDTSPAQWAIVEALAAEFFAGAGQHPRPRTLFVVGDEKQSIYSFQGADLANLRAVRTRLAQAADPALSEEVLDLSYRSTGAVLAVVDAVLKLHEAAAGVIEPNHLVQHRSHRRNEAGLVELWPLVVPLAGGAELEPWQLPGVPRAVDDPEQLVAGAIARTISDWLGTGERLAATGAPIRPRDILILLSRRGTAQEQIIRALKHKLIPVAGTDRLALTAHIAVQDLVALGKAVLLPEDDLTFACLLKSPLVGLDDDDLLLLTEEPGPASLLERLHQLSGAKARFRSALDRIEGWLQQADFMPPFEFYCRVLGTEGGRRRLIGRLGEEAIEPIEAFLGQCLAYEEGNPASLERFLHWLGAGEQQLKRDPEGASDAVRVLTVHGAKGLEAPIVFLADAGPHGRAQPGRLIWDPESGLPIWRGAKHEREAITAAAVEREEEREQGEARRLLYVAMTRARDRLYVTGWSGREKAASWHRHITAAMESLGAVRILPSPLGERFDGPLLRYEYGVRGEGVTHEASLPLRRTLPPWATVPAAEEAPALRPRSPSSLGEPVATHERLAGPIAAGRIRRGLIVHKLLELLPELPPLEREAAGRRWLQRSTQELVAAERASLLDHVLRVLAMPELAAAFGPGACAEQPLCGTVAGRPMVGQVDRLAVNEDEVVVIDYKTGAAPAAGALATPASYLRQMAGYRTLLRAIWPGRPVRCGLLWTELPRLDLLPDDLLDRHRPVDALTLQMADP